MLQSANPSSSPLHFSFSLHFSIWLNLYPLPLSYSGPHPTSSRWEVPLHLLYFTHFPFSAIPLPPCLFSHLLNATFIPHSHFWGWGVHSMLLFYYNVSFPLLYWERESDPYPFYSVGPLLPSDTVCECMCVWCVYVCVVSIFFLLCQLVRKHHSKNKRVLYS